MQHIASHGADVGMAAEGHGGVEFLGEDFEATGHARFAESTQAVEMRAADHRATCAEGDGLEHVLTAANAAVQPEFDLIADGVRNGGQHFDGRQCAVQLAATVIGDHE